VRCSPHPAWGDPLAALTRVAIHASRTLSWYPAMHWVQLVGDASEGHFDVLLAVGAIS
jgi:hypothetical protein